MLLDKLLQENQSSQFLLPILIHILVELTSYNFYTKIIEPSGHQAKERNDDFMQSYAQMINKFTKEFADTFCKNDGSIDWDKLVRFNSATVDQTK